jgi:uncharacterized phage protein (TIGR02218 family)
MKTLGSGFAAHVAQTVTTLAWCWKLTRNDGAVQGFTDHDRNLVMGGVTYLATSGFTASQIQSQLDFSVDNLEVTSALSSDTLNEDDLAAGLYDGALVEIWRVNWADTTQAVLMRKGSLGEVKRGKAAFQAGINGLLQVLNQAQGHVFGFACDADLGDARCTIDLTNPLFNGSGAVAVAIDGRRFTATGLGAFADAFFSGGKITWTSGANAGLSMEVKRHAVVSTTVSIELWQAMSETVDVSDTFAVTAGCDKTFATCKAKFANVGNFRGFPYMIGNDGITSYPNSSQNLSGSSRYGN